MSQQKNPLFSNLLDAMSDRFSFDSLNMSMTQWMLNNTTLNRKPFTTGRYPFQTQILDDMHPDLCCIKPSQVGLSLKLSTPIFTTKGWKTMETLKVGDMVFDEKGKPCNVTYKSPVWVDRECYKITFCTKEEIICDGSHRWYVEGYKAFHPDKGLRWKTGRLPKHSKWTTEGVVNTKFLLEHHKHPNFPKRNLFAIPCTEALKIPKGNLPIDPYFLGLWLGDGSSIDTTLTGCLDDLEEITTILKARGFSAEKIKTSEDRTPQVRYRKQDLRKRLKKSGILNNKHIPSIYLYSNQQQRLEIIQGLLDTDGSITKRGRVSFYNTNPRIVEAFEQLVHSLGHKTHTRWRDVKGKTATLKNGNIIKSKKSLAEVSFTPYEDLPVFKLKRKFERQKKLCLKSKPTETFRRRIVSVEKVPSTPTQCITVDSPKHLYLAGKGLIPTHNTEGQIRKALAFLMRNQGTSLIYTLPNEDMYKRISDARIRPIVTHDKVFNPPSLLKPIRRKDLMELGRSKLYVAPAIEGTATSIDADAVFVDEIDLSNQKMIALLNSRMQNSDWKIKQQFSTPTFPAYGVHQSYEQSDKNVFLRKCSSCNHWNEPKFDRRHVHVGGLPKELENLTDIESVHIPLLDFNDCYVKCEKCHSPLDMKNYDLTEWVTTHPSITEYRGYKVTPFSTDRLPPSYLIKQLIQYKSKEFVRGFYNTGLGEPYSDGSMQISHELIAQAFKKAVSIEPEVGSLVPVWLGIDMGQICNLIGGTGTNKDNMQPIFFRTCNIRDLEKTIKEIMDNYHLVGGVIDRQPYTPQSERIMEITKGKIVPAQYAQATSIKLDAFSDVTYALLARTDALDFVHTRMKRQNIQFNGYGTYKTMIEIHLRDMVREDNDEKLAVWTKLTNRDHFFHSLGYLLAAPDIKELVAQKLKEDQRETLIVAGAQLGERDPHDALIGFGGRKTVDKIIASRVLN